MSEQPPRFTPHAIAALARRGIAQEEVLRVIEAPRAVLPGNRPGREVAEGMVMIGDPPTMMLLRVVLDTTVMPREVVTGYVTTQFRKYRGGAT